MGHGVAAALAATLCVSTLRNARNQGASLLELVNSANQSLFAHAAANSLEDYVTGLIRRVDLRTGSMAEVNAGHVAPYLVRDQHVDLPLGFFGDTVHKDTQLGAGRPGRLRHRRCA